MVGMVLFLLLLGALLSATVLACIRATGPAWALVSASFIIGLLSMDTTPGELAAPLLILWVVVAGTLNSPALRRSSVSVSVMSRIQSASKSRPRSHF